jgi:hypothetical protein
MAESEKRLMGEPLLAVSAVFMAVADSDIMASSWVESPNSMGSVYYA